MAPQQPAFLAPAAAARVGGGGSGAGVAALCARVRVPAAAAAARRRGGVAACEAPPPGEGAGAEATRRALSADAPLVKFRRAVDVRTEDDVGFSYTSGNEGAVDVWLVSGVLFFAVPLAVFAYFVATGVIDVTPR